MMPSKKKIDQVWDKGRKIRGRNPNLWRKDDFDIRMYKPAYGTGGKTGWEIDHKKPRAKGGSDALSNLRPLNTEKNRQRGAKQRKK